MQAFSAALGQALGVLSQDPLLVANYGVFAGLSFVTGILFWFLFRNLDKEENALNDMRRKEDYQDARQVADREGSMPEYGQAPAPASASVEKRNV
jgi:POT family proton-dependent oligopeptide transporter